MLHYANDSSNTKVTCQTRKQSALMFFFKCPIKIKSVFKPLYNFIKYLFAIHALASVVIHILTSRTTFCISQSV